MSSIFTRIINGEIPSYKVYEDDNVIPKIEVDYIFDLADQELADLNIFAKKVAISIEKVISCKRVGILVIGTEVPHAHIHLIPFNDEAEFDITRKRIELSKAEFIEIANKIKATLS